jgi:hypothetical protein
VFTARYALSPYIKQILFVFKRLITVLSVCFGTVSKLRSLQSHSVIILSDNFHHSSLRPFRVTAGSATLAAYPVCGVHSV